MNYDSDPPFRWIVVGGLYFNVSEDLGLRPPQQNYLPWHILQ